MGEADLAMVLHPNFWGYGKLLLMTILRRAFCEMGKDSVVIFFPPTRTKVRSIYRLGFKKEKDVELYGEKFILYRLHSSDARSMLFG
jgi:ribosomal-protein-alanine N-acetyltransferase